MDPFLLFLTFIAVLLFSVIIHEVSHGVVAYMLGDPTAKLMGRLTLNPIPHIDPFGTIIVPLLLMVPALFGMPTVIFGWAKPVPYNPYNLRYQRWGGAIVGLAGPAANFLLALTFGLALRFIDVDSALSPLFPIALVFGIIVYLNLLLGIFNLLPIPPLDGSKILFALPGMPRELEQFLTRYGFFLLILFIFFGFQLILPIIAGAFQLITGYSVGLIF